MRERRRGGGGQNGGGRSDRADKRILFTNHDESISTSLFSESAPPLTHLFLQVGVELEDDLNLSDHETKLAARERDVQLNVAVAARRGGLRAEGRKRGSVPG